MTGAVGKSGTTQSAAGVTGTYICWYGRATAPQYGQSCGEVWSIYGQPSYASDPASGVYGCSNGPSAVTCAPNYVEVRADTYAMYVANGDSGAPMFNWTSAYGILSGSANYEDATGNLTAEAYAVWYTSVDEMIRDGYSIIYG